MLTVAPASTAAPRTRRAPRRLAIVALIAVVTLFAVACSPQQMAVVERVNSTRVQHGVRELIANPTAMNKAQAWADHMAATGTLAHSTLSDGVSPGWRALGENVGRGPSIDAIQAGFMASPSHRDNLLNPRWNWVATGVSTASDGTVYVVQVFLEY